MTIYFKLSAVLLMLSANIFAQENDSPLAVWLTNPDKSSAFEQQAGIEKDKLSKESNLPVINVNPGEKYQLIDGFGFTLTGGSALHIHNMSPEARRKLLIELFSTEGTSIGVSYLRISIGASDLDEEVFSYDDLPNGATDLPLDQFSLQYDKQYLIPVIQEILSINPHIKLLGSPWSAPIWMKTNQGTVGGSLKTEYYEVYARYFVKYIQQMKENGVRIDAITIQNEPLHPGNNPSMYMPPETQALFIKKYLGPAFKASGLDTKIIIYDHNADRIDYPLSVLADAEAYPFIDGSAFHLYGGDIDELSKVHNAYPEKNLYFTEQWIGAPGDFPGDLAWHTENLIIGATRNWCRAVLEWNLAANSKNKPHTDMGGCTSCLGGVTIDGDYVVRNPAYYIVAHASKFVRPGSVRINSTLAEGLPNVAFQTPDGKLVLIVLNTKKSDAGFQLDMNGNYYKVLLKPGAVATYVWTEEKTPD
jgi:glucosylceramidase